MQTEQSAKHPVVEITGLAHGGHGVGRVEGQVYFVPCVLPGDVVRVRNVRKTKGVMWADAGALVKASEFRTEPPCPAFGECGGCSWLHFAYPAQADWKRRIVSDCLQRIGGIAVDVAWVEDETLRLGYRTRAEFHGDGERVGFYGSWSHDVVDLAACPLCHPKLNAALDRLRAAKPRCSVEITVNPDGDDVLVWTKSANAAVNKAFPTLQTERDDAPRHSFVFDGIPVVNGTFSQSSLLLNRLLTRAVRDALKGAHRVLDLYCGNGNFSAMLPGATQVLGLDHNRSVVAAANTVRPDAYRVASEGGFGHALRASAWDVILLDPPRTGAKAIAQDLGKADAGRIVYVSCDPATLARDAKAIVQAGWRVDSVTAIDMFPNTAHIESVCVFERK
ncbi:MAG: TRAM domain-containing protein [Candidatus Hydrogenedentes bacterium]|nr:TRAM domain-containing protein [Candidatus Hydrogenedentota bacterium]